MSQLTRVFLNVSFFFVMVVFSTNANGDDRDDKRKTPASADMIKQSEASSAALEKYLKDTHRIAIARASVGALNDGLEILKIMGKSYSDGEFTKKEMVEALAKTPLANSLVVPESFRFAKEIATNVAPDLLWDAKQGSMTAKDVWQAFEKLGVDLPTGAPLGNREFKYKIDRITDTAKGESTFDAMRTIRARYPKAANIEFVGEVSR